LRRISFRSVLVLVTLLTTGPVASAADDCTRVRDVDARYRRILGVFERGESSAKVWWYGWTGGYVAATVGQGVLGAVTHDRGTRIDSIVGAAESAVGVAGMLLAVPKTPMWAAGELTSMDGSTPCARLHRLRRAEKLLEKSADEEAQARSWFSQLLGGAINLAAPIVLWAGYKRYASGWYTLGPGLAVQEAQILTQPVAALAAWNSYEREYRAPKQASWTIAPQFGGASIVGTF
jgi:hypothetical protein